MVVDKCYKGADLYEVRIFDGKRCFYKNGEPSLARLIAEEFGLNKSTLLGRISNGHALRYCLEPRASMYWRTMSKKNGSEEWLPEHFSMLKEMQSRGCTASDIAEEMGRTIGAICNASYRLGIWFRNRWSADEIRHLRSNYGKEKVEVMAIILGRTPGAIISRAKKLGLRSALCSSNK